MNILGTYGLDLSKQSGNDKIMDLIDDAKSRQAYGDLSLICYALLNEYHSKKVD